LLQNANLEKKCRNANAKKKQESFEKRNENDFFGNFPKIFRIR
jgi:hypothetical protein